MAQLSTLGVRATRFDFMKTPKKQEPTDDEILFTMLAVISDRLALIEAKVDMLQHDVCGNSTREFLGYLDPKRIRLTKSLASVRKNEMVAEHKKYGVVFGAPKRV